MPVCTVYLLCLHNSVATFVAALKNTPLKPLIVARVARWIITPSTLSQETLLHPAQPWDVLLILRTTSTILPKELEPLVKNQWSIQAGVPSKLLSSFESTNRHLLDPSTGDLPPLSGALSHPKIAKSSQALELSDELRRWISSDKAPKGAVTMLNLLAFAPNRKDEYLKYGQAFAESIGSRRGGIAKIVGKVVHGSCSDGCDEWEEIALAHYPSLDHFADMIASEDYQEVNMRYRIPSLKDTCILCTSELAIEQHGSKASL
ncbi:MAG: hypothetical protein Q9181_001549 [Wetmoreana brouardii]